MIPTGGFQILSLKDGRSLLKDTINLPNQFTGFVVLSSKHRHLLVISTPNRTKNGVTVYANSGGSEIIVGGDAYGYDVKTGKRVWVKSIKTTVIDPIQRFNSPFVIFSARQYSRVKKKGKAKPMDNKKRL